MAKRTRRRIPFVNQPHLLGVEDELREREGVMLIALLTDEAGALMLRQGKVPKYLKAQCVKALDWCATEYRGLVVGEKVSA